MRAVMNLPADLDRVARIARALIDAALANRDIQGYLRNLTPPRLWTVEGVRRNPTCRVEWEHVTVTGGIGEALAASRHKSWGEFLGACRCDPTTRSTGAASSTSTRRRAPTTAVWNSARPSNVSSAATGGSWSPCRPARVNGTSWAAT
jgi:hypothetical protein